MRPLHHLCSYLKSSGRSAKHPPHIRNQFNTKQITTIIPGRFSCVGFVIFYYLHPHTRLSELRQLGELGRFLSFGSSGLRNGISLKQPPCSCSSERAQTPLKCKSFDVVVLMLSFPTQSTSEYVEKINLNQSNWK